MVESSIVEILTRSNQLMSLLGGTKKVYVGEVPASGADEAYGNLPYVIYGKTNTETLQHTLGSLLLSRYDFDFDAWAISFKDARRIADLMSSLLLGFRGVVGAYDIQNMIKDSDSDIIMPQVRAGRKRIHGITMTFGVWATPI